MTLDDFKAYILQQYDVIHQTPLPFFMALICSGVIIWIIIYFLFKNLLAIKDAEISMLERKTNNHSPSAFFNNFLKEAKLSLHFYDDERTPTKIKCTNIWRWYHLRMVTVLIEKETFAENKVEMSNLFITFDNPVEIGTLEVSSTDFKMPKHEVKELTNRYAIIAFSGKIPVGTITIHLH